MCPSSAIVDRKVRYGMIGGGKGAFIGPVHARALNFTGTGEIVAGAFSSDAARSRESASIYKVKPERAYATWAEMLAREAEHPEGIDAVIIVTPNKLHIPAATDAMTAGYDVVTDKPISDNLLASLRFAEFTRDRKEIVAAVTHQYLMFPAAIHGANMVRDGAIGTILRIEASYTQGWLSTPLEQTGQKQAGWRTNPAEAGAGSIGDIGTHAFIQALRMGNVSEEDIVRLRSTLRSFVPGRPIDDFGHATMETKNGTFIAVTSSQIDQGERNHLRVKIVGTTGTLIWDIEHPEDLILMRNGQPVNVFQRGASLSGSANSGSYIPGGHPEGYNEGMANVYSGANDRIIARRGGVIATSDLSKLIPGLKEGLAGMRYIDASLKSNAQDGIWVPFNQGATN